MNINRTLYHGSEKIVKKPEYGKGNPRNDYGLGFYCTEDLELAKEWACGDKRGGFANIYTINISGISVINLSKNGYGIINWLAVLVNNRIFSITSPMAAEAKDYLTEFFLPDLSLFDAITGYRADDSYFAFAMDFLSNIISLRQLGRAMRFGDLGEQFVLKSPKSFDLIQFVKSEAADGEIYYPKRRKRDADAREQYLKKERKTTRFKGDIFMLDILRKEIKQGDERLQENLPE
jgi:hypothetical protein